MKTQLPAQKQSHTVIPAPAARDAGRKGNHARWQGAPFNAANFHQSRLPQIQAKMRVSQPHDPQEREADETAAKIMNMPEPVHSDAAGDSATGGTSGTGADHASATAQTGAPVQRQTASSSIIVARSAPVISEVQRQADSQSSGNSLISRESENEEREEAEEKPQQDVARKVSSGAAEAPPGEGSEGMGSPDGFPDAGSGSDAAGADASAGMNGGAASGGDGTINLSGNGSSGGSGVDASVESRIRALRGRGQPLHANEKSFFESRFGRDFSRVRLHTDGQSQDLAKQVNAKAFAVGENIVFGRGYYQPGTRDGRELMAHELTHVVQQGKAPAIGATSANPANAKASAEAAKAGGAKAAGNQRTAANTAAPAGPAISRRAAEGETVHRAPLGEESKGLLSKISGFADKFAGNIPGFRLVTLILGFNPITQKNVPRTALNFVGAVAALIPGGDVLFQRIQKSGVLVQAFNWLTKEFSKLGITLTLITELLKTGLQRLKGIGILGAAFSFVTGSLFPKILRILKEVFGPTLTKLINFVKKVAVKIKEFVFRGFIRLVGGREGPIFQFLNPITNLLGRIFNDPISFGRNLLGAVGKGFKQFMGNFVKHFKGALFGWMFGTFSKAGIDVPKTFEPAAIFGFVAQLFAVTWTDIRAKIVKRMGPKGNTIMTAVEKSIEVVTILITKGPGGLYEKIKEDLGSLKETILSAVLEWVRNTIIVKAIIKIASLLNPAGAIVQAILAIYNVVMFFIERFEQIKALVQGIMGALQNIVLGKIGPAANKVETTMARGLTLVISFLARLVGLGNIVKPVQKVIKRIKKRIDKAIDKIIRQITVRARRLWRKLRRKKGKNTREGKTTKQQNKDQQRLDKAVAAIKPQAERLLSKGAKGILWRGRLKAWKLRYRLTELREAPESDTFDLIAKVNPVKKVINDYLNGTERGVSRRKILNIVQEVMQEAIDSAALPTTRKRIAQRDSFLSHVKSDRETLSTTTRKNDKGTIQEIGGAKIRTKQRQAGSLSRTEVVIRPGAYAKIAVRLGRIRDRATWGDDVTSIQDKDSLMAKAIINVARGGLPNNLRKFGKFFAGLHRLFILEGARSNAGLASVLITLNRISSGNLTFDGAFSAFTTIKKDGTAEATKTGGGGSASFTQRAGDAKKVGAVAAANTIASEGKFKNTDTSFAKSQIPQNIQKITDSTKAEAADPGLQEQMERQFNEVLEFINSQIAKDGRRFAGKDGFKNYISRIFKKDLQALIAKWNQGPAK